jgi:hypothetical protein
MFTLKENLLKLRVSQRSKNYYLVSSSFYKQKVIAAKSKTFPSLFLKDLQGEITSISTRKQPKNHSNSTSLFFEENKELRFPVECKSNEKLLNGQCKRESFTFSEKKISCLASHFKVNCDLSSSTLQKPKDCLLEIKEKEGTVEGKPEKVVSELIYLNEQGKKETLLNPLCDLIELKILTSKERKECGYYCFAQQFDTIHDQENNLNCLYYPTDENLFTDSFLSGSSSLLSSDLIYLVKSSSLCESISSEKSFAGGSPEASKYRFHLEKEEKMQKELSELKKEMKKELKENEQNEQFHLEKEQKMQKEIDELKEEEQKMLDNFKNLLESLKKK